MITWKKTRNVSHWNGSVGDQDFEAREKFGISKVKPSNAPHTLWAARARRHAGKVWSFNYVLYVRSRHVVYNVGMFPSFDAAKAAAAELAAA